jgi:hypothetical protein
MSARTVYLTQNAVRTMGRKQGVPQRWLIIAVRLNEKCMYKKDKATTSGSMVVCVVVIGGH